MHRVKKTKHLHRLGGRWWPGCAASKSCLGLWVPAAQFWFACWYIKYIWKHAIAMGDFAPLFNYERKFATEYCAQVDCAAWTIRKTFRYGCQHAAHSDITRITAGFDDFDLMACYNNKTFSLLSSIYIPETIGAMLMIKSHVLASN